MYEIKLNIPDESLVALKLSPSKAGDAVRLAAAVKLFELGRLSSRAAAALAGIPRRLFLSKLADYAARTFRLSLDGLRWDLRRA